MPRYTLLVLATVVLSGCGEIDACASCAISAERIATIGDADGDGALEGRPLVSATFADRRIVLQPDAMRGLPLLFTASGQFISTIGAAGDGPGEFRSPSRVLVDGDSAWVIDGSLRRATAISPNGDAGTALSWMRVPYDAIARGDGSWIVAAGEGSRRALSKVSASGTVEREFSDAITLGDARWHVARDGMRFWSAPALHSLRFEEWSAPDSLLRTIEPATPHFPPYARRLPATPDRPPQPSLRGFWTDSLSRIWALLEVPAPDWRSGYGNPRIGEGGQTYMSVLDANRVYASVILVIDPATGTVVADRTLEGWFYYVVEPFVILRAVQDSDGWYRGELWQVAMRAP